MRRPPPLPPTASIATDGDSATGAGPEQSEEAGESLDRSDDREALAPVIALDGPARLPDMASDDAAPAPFGTTGEGDPIRVRDVWRAARARRRALRAEVRRFTVRQRRRRMLWLGAGASVVLLILTTLAAAYSPLFGVERVTVVGTSLLDPVAVEQALDDQVGTPLPLVDESAVKAALIAFPLVQSYSLEARPPHELVVRIVERLPIGLVQSRAGYTLVDSAGVALSTTESPAAGRPLLTIAGGTDSRAFKAVGQVMRTLPASIRDQVTAISATTADDVTLRLGGANCDVVWGSADDSAMKALVLEKVMLQRPPATVRAYDVSSPHAVVVR